MYLVVNFAIHRVSCHLFLLRLVAEIFAFFLFVLAGLLGSVLNEDEVAKKNNPREIPLRTRLRNGRMILSIMILMQ